jgi:putative oxidoreductase
MGEFVEFLAQHGFPLAWLLAPLSVAVQFGCGALLVAGLLARLAGLLVAGNFAVAVLMVHWHEPFRGWWPALVLVFLGLHFAAAGSGRIGLDALFGRRR